MKLPADLAALAAETVTALAAAGITVATAESCTGGLITGALTSVAGSSDVVYGGYVAYANEAKMNMLGVPFAMLHEFGAVSAEVAGAMAEGALAASGTHVAIAVTGIAGPGGGSADKPVGLVHFGLADREATRLEQRVFPGDREAVRHATVRHALEMLLAAAKR